LHLNENEVCFIDKSKSIILDFDAVALLEASEHEFIEDQLNSRDSLLGGLLTMIVGGGISFN
jgi:hypothetical protein